MEDIGGVGKKDRQCGVLLERLHVGAEGGRGYHTREQSMSARSRYVQDECQQRIQECNTRDLLGGQLCRARSNAASE